MRLTDTPCSCTAQHQGIWKSCCWSEVACATGCNYFTKGPPRYFNCPAHRTGHLLTSTCSSSDFFLYKLSTQNLNTIHSAFCKFCCCSCVFFSAQSPNSIRNAHPRHPRQKLDWSEHGWPRHRLHRRGPNGLLERFVPSLRVVCSERKGGVWLRGSVCA